MVHLLQTRIIENRLILSFTDFSMNLFLYLDIRFYGPFLPPDLSVFVDILPMMTTFLEAF